MWDLMMKILKEILIQQNMMKLCRYITLCRKAYRCLPNDVQNSAALFCYHGTLELGEEIHRKLHQKGVKVLLTT